MKHQTIIKKIGKLNIADPQFGDMKLSVMPFENNHDHISLPVGFEIWEEIGVPDIIIVPCGNGTLLFGIYKAFVELLLLKKSKQLKFWLSHS